MFLKKKRPSAEEFIGVALTPPTEPASGAPKLPSAPPSDSADRPRASRQRKRNRRVEKIRRHLSELRRKLYARARALHDAADDLKQDDPDARFDEDIPSTSTPRLRAREIEAIADCLFGEVFGK